MKRILLLLFILCAILIVTDLHAQAEPQIGFKLDWGGFFGDGLHPEYAYGLTAKLPTLDWIGLNKTSVKRKDITYTFSVMNEMAVYWSKTGYDDNSDMNAQYAGVVARKTLGISTMFLDFGGGTWNFVDAEGEDDKTYIGYNLGIGMEPGGVLIKLGGHIIPINSGADLYAATVSIGYDF